MIYVHYDQSLAFCASHLPLKSGVMFPAKAWCYWSWLTIHFPMIHYKFFPLITTEFIHTASIPHYTTLIYFLHIITITYIYCIYTHTTEAFSKQLKILFQTKQTLSWQHSTCQSQYHVPYFQMSTTHGRCSP